MKARITEECIACGQCVDVCPEVFEMGSDIATVKLNSIPDEHLEQTKEAVDICPVDAIKLEES